MMALNIALMVWWIITASHSWAVLTLGTIAFALVLIGISYYLFLTIKERQFNRRQMNFVDSVTHELKSPIASLRLYLETLQLRDLDPAKRAEFYATMDVELKRLDEMISQLLRVARLDAIGQDAAADECEIETVLRTMAANASAKHRCDVSEVFEFEITPVSVHGPQIMLEMIFGNLFDNAIKYGGKNPRIVVQTEAKDNNRIEVRTIDNGDGVPLEIRRSIFRLFFRGGNELERKQKGTGIGLYVAQTLVRKLGGKLRVQDREQESGSVFVVELPGKVVAS